MGLTGSAALRILWQRQYVLAADKCMQCAACRGLFGNRCCQPERRWSQYDILCGAVLSIWDKLGEAVANSSSSGRRINLSDLRVLRSEYTNASGGRSTAVGIELRRAKVPYGSAGRAGINITAEVIHAIGDEDLKFNHLERERAKDVPAPRSRARRRRAHEPRRPPPAAADVIDMTLDSD